ncbi:hypothetical protein [Mycobacterium sp. shizuoka-1]|uniref:hypothetical protein n=1 Tax=Mycobacterium sp. shizuoka-1 TaxID=2039281 RepID=UPI000C067D62|nr:hypothetical protein [Mycobacterium sp. shizuoka-1]GAY18451.1 hypothetical protein MSZK_51770 [Mycobacterium sp. shizuoka-1]
MIDEDGGDMTGPEQPDLNQWAFRVRPAIEQFETGWRASYPGTEWSVIASTEGAARQRLQEEAENRRRSGVDPFEGIYRKHLREAIPGVYAMDNALYREVARTSGYDQTLLQTVFEESERRRAAGQRYTLAEYRAEQAT